VSDIPKSADTIYTQRAALAVAVARMILMQGGRAGTKPPEPGGWPVLYIDLPDGSQLSYHFSSVDAHLLEGLPPYSGEWDGTFLGRGSDWLKAIPMPAPLDMVTTISMAEAVAFERLSPVALRRWGIERKKLEADTDVLPEVAAQILMGYARRW